MSRRLAALYSSCFLGFLFFSSPAFADYLFVSSFDNQAVYMLNATTGSVIRTYTDTRMACPTGLALSSDGKTLYVGNSGSSDADILAFNTTNGSFLHSYSAGGVTYANGLALTNDNQTLYVTSSDNRIYKFNTDTGDSSTLMSLANRASDLQLSIDGKTLYSSSSLGDCIYKISTSDKSYSTFSFDPDSNPYGMALSSSTAAGTRLYTAMYNSAGSLASNTIAVLDATTGQKTQTLTIGGDFGNLAGLDISADGTTLYTCDSSNYCIYRYKLSTGATSKISTSASLSSPGFILYSNSVPEPSLLSLILSGLILGLIGWARKQCK